MSPSPQAFVTAALAGMDRGMHPQALIAAYLKKGSLVKLVPNTPLDVPLHWRHARAASGMIDSLRGEIVAAASASLLPR
jgi:LysR family transcriptional regulator (chromosome initiation inhibitor)